MRPWRDRRTLRRALALAVLATSGVAATMAAPAGGAAAAATETASEAAASGGFDLATVEELALYFAEESVRRLHVPLVLRLVMGGGSRQEELEKIRRDPPTANADGVVYPFGDSNPLSFVHDPEARTLIVWERMIKKRGSIGLWGLTGPETAAALNAASTRRDRGGADFAYDALGDALSFRLVYRRPPADRKRFYEEVNRVVATQLDWSEKRFLKEMNAIVEARKTPASATASAEGFGATVALRHFSATREETGRWVWRYVQAWSRPAPRQAPRMISDAAVHTEQPLHAFLLFQGAAADAAGKARVEADLRLVGPEGGVRSSTPGILVYDGEAPPVGHLQLGDCGATLELAAGEPPGAYRVEADVCDRVADRCVSLAHPIVLIDG
ncbi:MAG: hypothetical protein H6511_01800 [Holophagales bacterium]|nr:hypothetical protein [Holophagales bacterium]